MTDGDKPNHLGTILIVAGLVLLLLVIGLGGFLLVHNASKSFATFEGAGEHTFVLPSAGEYVLARRESLDPGTETLTVETPGEGLRFSERRQNMYIVVGENRFKVLGTLAADVKGEHTIAVTADAYPITVRHEPMAMANRVGTIFLALVTIPIVTTIIGVVIAVRNTNRRNRAILEETL